MTRCTLFRLVPAAILSVLAGPINACAQAPRAVPLALSADSTAVLRNTLVSADATQGDLAMLDSAFRALHPALYRYNTPAGWAARVDSLRGWFGVPRTRGETFLALSALAASLQCSHTYLSFWNQPRAVHQWLTDGADKLPFEYDLLPNDEWVVRRTGLDTVRRPDLAILPGDTVRAVNGVPTARIIAMLMPYLRGDGDDAGKRRALLDFRHRKEFEAIDVFLPLILPPQRGAYAVTLRRPGAARDTTVQVASMPSAVRRARAVPVRPDRPLHELTRDGAVAILRVDAFDYGRDADRWAPFVTRTFRALAREGVKSLVLDLRENEGGSDEGAAFLLRHLIRADLTLPPVRRYVAYEVVPSSLKPLLNTWDKDFYDRRGKVTPRGDGTFDLKDNESWPTSIRRSPDAFNGRVYVLTSYVNSSASHIMLRLLARQPGVTVVGDPTGGSLRAHTGGNLFFMQLKGTGMEVDLPLIAYDWGMNNPAGGVQPDVRVPASEALEAALRLARNGTRAVPPSPRRQTAVRHSRATHTRPRAALPELEP